MVKSCFASLSDVKCPKFVAYSEMLLDVAVSEFGVTSVPEGKQ